MSRPRRGKGVLIAGGVAILVLAALTVWLGPLLAAALRAGFLDQAQDRTVKVDSTASLERIHKALLMYAESEGSLPEAGGWMDAAWTRLKTADVREDEAKKLFKSSPSQGENEYGFAMNKALSKADPQSGDQAAVLVYEVARGGWNESGQAPSPEAGGPRRGVTLGGKVVRLKP